MLADLSGLHRHLPRTGPWRVGDGHSEAGVPDGGFDAMLRNEVLAMVVDVQGRLQYVNPGLLALGGWSWADIAGRLWFDVWVPAGERRRACLLFEAGLRKADAQGCFEMTFSAADGTARTIAWASRAGTDDDGTVVSIASIGVDVTCWADERDELAAKLDYNEAHDLLTGLPSDDLLRRKLSMALYDAHGGGHHVAAMVLTVDRFRSITEAVGHEISDLLLRDVAERLTGRAPGATVSRVSGDEFAIVFPGVPSPEFAMSAAQELMDAMRAPVTIFATEFHLEVSIGVALSSESDGVDCTTLLRNAAIAMRRAKSEGGNSSAIFTASLSEDAMDRLAIEHHLRGAIERNELSVQYQPQVDADTHRIIGLEALARWDNPVLGSVPPARFIPIAEMTGMIGAIGLWVLRVACEQGRRWRAEGVPPVTIAVNLSARQLTDRTLVADITKILEDTGTPAGQLELEVTESAVMENMDTAADVLRELGALGIKISLDDFGTGYNCISYLNHLSVGTIKIDRSFLQASPVVEDANAVVRALILIARSLHLRVIAEGVETDEQLERLKNDDEQCDAYQGFLFSRPVAASVARSLLMREGPLAASPARDGEQGDPGDDGEDARKPPS
jgi:diguanylate cyclase (GGDEF)-like protein/PAS domain S-box-containing protein